MSLLMDALRKAEQEKKEAAKRLKETTGSPTGDVTGSHDQMIAKETVAKGDITSEQAVKRLDPTVVRSKDELFAATAELSLEPIENKERQIPSSGAEKKMGGEDETLNINADNITIYDDEDQTTDEPPEQAELQVGAAAEEDTGGDGADNPLDATFHSVHLDQHETPALFEETIKDESFVASEIDRSYEETLPGIPAVELARDIGEENQPTPVAAQTVFTAGSTANINKKMNWPLISGATVTVMIAASVVIYLSVTPIDRNLPSPVVARGIETLIPPTREVTTAPQEVNSGTLIAGTEPTGAEIVSQPETIDESAGETFMQTDTAVLQTASEDVAVGSGVSEESVSQTVPGIVQSPADFPPVVDKAIPATAEQEIENVASLFKISRKKVLDDRGQLINTAYAAYQKGEYTLAKEKYGEILKAYPDNRDALLGLGALAISEGDLLQAFNAYSKILRNNPQDNYAKAMLLSMQGGNNQVARESAIKLMLHENPKEPLLFFTLGNIFAAQARWADAQQAFFDAYRNDSSNPDYALNLAISLDRVGQRETALDYYHTALKLADARKAAFDTANVMERIRVLTGEVRP